MNDTKEYSNIVTTQLEWLRALPENIELDMKAVNQLILEYPPVAYQYELNGVYNDKEITAYSCIVNSVEDIIEKFKSENIKYILYSLSSVILILEPYYTIKHNYKIIYSTL